ncbi:MAG: tryptophan--tRNA ligase [Acidobacteria bacterium]|nr:tryptophan--tRNA ligase [Acidobacteriota bacterium]
MVPAVARVLSGIQPSGEVHLGNYIGALRHWVADQDRNDCFYVVVDLHAITVPQEPEALRAATLDLAAILLAVGIDPERSTLFVQSHVHEHAELAWVLGCFAMFGELRRMTQFKDKAHRQREASVSVGLFSYPVLQAADILIYQADRVPVGEDQRQHLELTRDVAQRFNGRFGETFVVPEAAIPPVGARIMDLQNPTAKMSKSADSPQGTIRVTDPPDVLARKIKTAVTEIPDLEEAYAGKGYADLKRDLAEALVEFLRPLQERYRDLATDPGEIARLLEVGAAKAQAVASKTLAAVYERVGFLPRG